MSENHRIADRAVSLAAVASVTGLAGLAIAAAPAARATDEAAKEPDLASLPLYPLAGTPLDVLSNNLVVPVGGTEVSTFPVTAPLHKGLPLGEMPVTASLLK
jgi:hypothetical protein